MKRNILFSIAISFLILSALFVACGSEDRKSDLTIDTVKTNVNKTHTTGDTAGNMTNDKSNFKDEKTENLPEEIIKHEKDTSSVKKDKIKVIAYYFHATARCPSCINIENFTEEIIKNQFAKEKKQGLITFRQLNIEDSVNEHYIEDYKLEFSAVILAKYVNNKQVKWKNLEHVWRYSNEKEDFFKYMKIEIKEFLKEKEGNS